MSSSPLTESPSPRNQSPRNQSTVIEVRPRENRARRILLGQSIDTDSAVEDRRDSLLNGGPVSIAGSLLAGAFEWLARADTENLWPRPEIDAFLSERMEPLWVDCRVHFTSIRTPPPNPAPPAVYHPDYGIAPFWILAQR